MYISSYAPHSHVSTEEMPEKMEEVLSGVEEAFGGVIDASRVVKVVRCVEDASDGTLASFSVCLGCER